MFLSVSIARKLRLVTNDLRGGITFPLMYCET
jgi:hypothetical protein